MRLKYTLKKYQILRSKKEIDYLFENGKSIVQYPLTLVYNLDLLSKYDYQKTNRFKVLFVVPKKNVKKSVYRNKVKRKIKESFRLQQHELNIPKGYICLLAFIYISKSTEEEELKKIDTSVKKLIEYLNRELDMEIST